MTTGYPSNLTAREKQVVSQLIHGLRDKEIGLRLGISSLTVRNHLRAAREKTGLTNRTQLAVYAASSGIAEASTC